MYENQAKLEVYFVWGILFLYCLPWIVFGQSSYILIHDMLDFYFPNLITINQSNMIFAPSSATIEQLMNAPRSTFGNELNIVFWLFHFFDPYVAYVINQIIIRVIALIGMYLLLKRYIFKYEDNLYTLAIALLYSLLPFYATAGLSVAGLPLITYVFLNIRNNTNTKKDWIWLVLFPFYSSFVLSMMFYIIIVGVVWLYDIYEKRLTKRFTIALFSFSILYLIVNYRLIEVFIFASDYVSHRVERVSEYKTFFESMKSSYSHFIKGQYHAHSLHIILLPFIVFVFIHSKINNNKNTIFNLLLLLNLIISLWYGFWKYEGWEDVKNSISILNSFNLSRFHFLTPLIWYTTFALAIQYFLKHIQYKRKHTVVISLIVIQVLFLFSKSDFVHVYKKENITYKEFFSENLFNKIDNYIQDDKQEYKVVSIGIHPSISIYNGFYTADGYLTNYSLEYKKRFRKVIAKELEKNKKLKKSFDNWGNRCYIYVDEVGYNFTRKKDEVKPINIDINSSALKDLDVKYIFSSYKINNAQDNNLKLLKLFEDKESAWDIYLYKIMEEI